MTTRIIRAIALPLSIVLTIVVTFLLLVHAPRAQLIIAITIQLTQPPQAAALPQSTALTIADTF